MTDAAAKIPQSLKDALRQGRVVPFVGAGGSLAVKRKAADGAAATELLFPSWAGFVKILAAKLRGNNKSDDAAYVEQCVKLRPPKYLEAMQHAFESLGEYLWYQAFTEQFDAQQSQADDTSLELPRAIWQLSRNLIITTNVDRVLQWTARVPADCKILDVQHAEYAHLQQEQFPPRPTVWHLHGHIDHKEKVVFTRAQFDAFYKMGDNEAKLRTLGNVLTQRSLLFIGFSLDDDYLREVLEYIRAIYAHATPPLYILFKESDLAVARLPDYVTPVTFADFGAPLLELVRELGRIAHENDSAVTPTPGAVAPPSGKRPFFNVPYGSKGEGFVGREGKVKEIRELLLKEGCAAIGQAVSVRGFGGLGKTQLAVEYAHAYRDQYAQGVFWLEADNDFNSQLLRIALEGGWINPEDKTVNQYEEAAKAFRGARDCLILCDNVEDFAAAQNYLPPSSSDVHLLVTSRERQPKFKEIGLELLTREASRQLLLDTAGRSQPASPEAGELEEILETLDGVPLAIELVGGYLSEHETISFKQYHQFLDEVPLDKLEAEFADSSFTKHDCSIIRTLRVSEKTARDKPLLHKILLALAWSGRGFMGISLLQAIVAADDAFAFANALSEAHKLRLVKKDDDAERYAAHRLLAKVIRHENPPDKLSERFRQLAGNLKDWFEQRKDEFTHLTEFETETEHLQEWQAQIRDISPELYVNLMTLESYPLWHRGVAQESLTLLERSYKLYERCNLTNPELLASIKNDLGVIHGELGRHEKALTYQMQALEIRQEVLGPRHPDTAMSLNNIGSTYSDLGRHEEALTHQRQALEIHQEVLGPRHPATAKSLNNIGSTYGELGRHEEALTYLRQALEVQQELLGRQHLHTIIIAGNTIITYRKLGREMEARKLAGEFLPYIPAKHPQREFLAKAATPQIGGQRRKKKKRW